MKPHPDLIDVGECRARDPLRRMQCDQVGPHERHSVTYQTPVEDDHVGIATSTWTSCGFRDHQGRPCLRVLRHTGAHDF